MEQARRQAFAGLLANTDADDALERGALLIAGRSRPEVDTADCLRQLDRLAGSALRSAPSVADAAELGRYLNGQAGFRGNSSEYYAPANSYLDQVLEQRTGIPISLAVVYIAVGRRLGLTLDAIGFPGHVLVGQGTDRQLLDPFSGEPLGDAGLAVLVERMFGRPVAIQPQWLAPLDPPAVWFRMLGNLRRIFMGERDFAAALECCDWQLLIDPRAAQELLDRGLLMEQMGNTAGAHAALRHFLLLHGDHHAAAAVQAKLEQLGRGQRWLH